MTKRLDVDALKALAEAATPRPWRWEGDNSKAEATLEPDVISASGIHTEGYVYISEADAEFIAAVKPATVLALLDRLEQAEAARDEWQTYGESNGRSYDSMKARAKRTEAAIAKARVEA